MKLDEKEFNGRTLRVSEAKSKGDNSNDSNNKGSHDYKNKSPDTLKLNDMPEHVTEEDIRKAFSK